jgi:hypothetical protein
MSDEKVLERSRLQAEPTPSPTLTNGSRVSYFPVSLVKLEAVMTMVFDL